MQKSTVGQGIHMGRIEQHGMNGCANYALIKEHMACAYAYFNAHWKAEVAT